MKFCVFAGARTGSSTLYEFFKDIGIHMRFEPFRPTKWNVQYSVEEELEKLYQRLDAIKHLHEHLSQAQNILLCHWLLQRNVSTIHLFRKDPFYAAVSKALAFQTGFWATTHLEVDRWLAYQTIPLNPIEIGELEGYIELSNLSHTIYRSMLIEGNYYPVTYEDLFTGTMEDRYRSVCQMLKFLFIPADELVERMFEEHFASSKKQNTAAMYRRIPNWKEIIEFFHVSEEE